MRTLLLGTDFMYNNNGDLVPIEINTNIGGNENSIEDQNLAYDVSGIGQLIQNNSINKVYYIGSHYQFEQKLSDYCASNNIDYEFFWVQESVTIPYIEDAPNILIIRSAYDITAIVDETYCANNVNFLNLIKDSAFGSQFAYLDENGDLINNITTIKDNGNNPNFILKSVAPRYNREEYPKLYKVTNQNELNVVLQNVNKDFFLMEYHFNPNVLISGNIPVIRSLNLMIPPSLSSIPVGQYTELCNLDVATGSTFNQTTYELNDNVIDKLRYTTHIPKFLTLEPHINPEDLIELADGTFKSADQVQVGDVLKTVIWDDNVTEVSSNLDFEMDYDTFVSKLKYHQNQVLSVVPVNRVMTIVNVTFDDNSTFSIPLNSVSITVKDNKVGFRSLISEGMGTDNFGIGDTIVLLDTSASNVVPVSKIITNIQFNKTVQSGFVYTVQETHLFLTKNPVNNINNSFAVVTHNATCISGHGGRGQYTCVTAAACAKGFRCCPASSTSPTGAALGTCKTLSSPCTFCAQV